MKKATGWIIFILMSFVFAACETTGEFVKKDGEESGKYALDAEQASAPEEKTESATTSEKASSLDSNTVAVIGGYVLTKKKYKIIQDYMKEKFEYTLTPEQEKEFVEYIVNKKLMAMEARNLDYDKREALKIKYEWDFDDLLSHAYYTEKVDEKARVTDKDAEEYYTTHSGDFSEIKARHILIKSKDFATSLYDRIKAGEDFIELAKKYSEDNTTRESGGELGYFGKGAMVQEFEQAAFPLSVGEVSEPVRTVYGYHIIKIDEKRKITYEDSKDKIKKMIEDRKKKEIFEAVIKTLKEKYEVKIK
ncbi:MAG: peptidylprolyl isomerase [bacterium]